MCAYWRDGAVAATVPFVTVKADGTGDYVDIQSAIDSLPASGGEIRISGNFTIDTKIEFGSKAISLIGTNWPTAILTADASLATNMIELIAGSSKSIIRDIAFNLTAQTNGSGLYLNGSDDCLFDNLYIHDADDYGVYFAGSTTLRNRIQRCIVYNCGSYGILNDSVGTQVIDCTTYNNGNHGIYSDANEVEIINCNSFNNGGRGISVGIKSKIIGCTTYSNGAHGIISGTDSIISNNRSYLNTLIGITNNASINGNNNTVIKGNRVYSNVSHGISIVRASKAIVTGNALSGNATGGTASEIYIGDYTTFGCIGNVICDNTIITTSGDYCIEEQSSQSDYNIIRDNVLEGGLSGYTNILGANSVSDNIQLP
jgi:parallel beta-helix repeat protein